MREYEFIIDKALKKGLFPTRSLPVNADWLQQAKGFRVGMEDLEGYTVSDNTPLSAIDMHYNWPFPQFIKGDTYNILVVRNILTEEDLVYTISDDYATINLIATIDQLTYGQGGLMEVVDFGEYAFMTNGVVNIHYDTSIPGWTILATSSSLPQMNTICNLKGQSIGGNITNAFHDCDATFYIWSKIGEFNFTPENDNEAGYRRCPYGGDVLNVRRLGNGVVGYSNKGITLLTPVAEPVVTLGFTELDDIGLINKGAIDGDERRHIYVGSDHILREVTSKGVKQLGFYSHISDLDSDDIIVKYDKSKKDFYIGDSIKTFLLSPYGLTEIQQHPSALWRMPDDQEEVTILPVTVDNDDPYISSAIFDMGYRGQKTISSVESDIPVLDEGSVSIGWINTLDDQGSTDYIDLNEQGIAAITVAGNSFMAYVKVNLIRETTSINYIKVRYKMTDLRGIRGVYAPPLRGQ